MSRYHLHARKSRGDLGHPDHNELQTAEGDNLDAMEYIADELREVGFTVWLYEQSGDEHVIERVPGDPKPRTPLAVIREWRPMHP